MNRAEQTRALGNGYTVVRKGEALDRADGHRVWLIRQKTSLYQRVWETTYYATKEARDAQFAWLLQHGCVDAE